MALSLACCLPLRTPAAAAPESDPVALKKRIIAALGGERRLAGLRSIRASGTLEGVSGFPGTYQLQAERPDRRRIDWDIKYLRQTSAVDGVSGWERVAAVRELAGDELARARHEARFEPLFALLQSGAPFAVANGNCDSARPANLLHFSPPSGVDETFAVDSRTGLPCWWARTETYEDGPAEVRTDYADFRRVRGLMLPYSIDEHRPDLSERIRISRYDINPRLAAEVFRNPEAAHAQEPVEITLATLPEHIFKEPDGHYTIGPQRYWGMYFYPTESWSLDLVVKERHGRYLEPESAEIALYAGAQRVSSQVFGRQALLALRRYPVSRFTPLGEIYGFRHNFTAASAEHIDRLSYTFTAQGPDGRTYHQTLDVPVQVYLPKTSLIFPLRGKFLVTSGHEYFEKEHKYERSQQFAIDIVALGDDFEFARNDGATMQDYVGYARREIIAPAAGRVVFARNDIPDGTVKADFLKMPDAITAPAGNVVIIDHGHEEFSIFCHMHFGSVRVKTGDFVSQGQVIGLLGAAGSPGLPHLHYQLQSGPNIFGNDGLPLTFTNIERVAWLGRAGTEDEHGSAPVPQPRAGVFMEAR